MDPANQPDDRLDLRRIQARHHLVEEEQRRLGRQRPRQLETLALGQGQRPRRDMLARGEPDARHDVARPRERVRRPGVPRQGADADVLEDGHAREGPDDLERPRQAELADRVRRKSDDGPAAEADVAGVRREKAREEIEDGGLAGAVGADEAQHLALGDRQVEPGHGVDASEALGQPPCLQETHRPAPVVRVSARFTRGYAPSGRKSTTAISSTP